MNLLNIDFKSMLPDVVDALSYVYGEKYRSSIQKKLDKAIMFYFYDFLPLKRYVEDFEKYYARKSAFQFLEANGISEEKSSEAFSNLIQNPNYFVNGKSPILAFGDYYSGSDFSRSLAKVQVINYFLDSSHKIDFEGLDDFSHTEEYKKIEAIARKYNERYEAILKDFQNSCEETQVVKEFLESEEVRKRNVYYCYAKKFCEDIMYLLPIKAQDVLYKVDKDELVKIFLSYNRPEDISDCLSEMSCFETFSKKNCDNLANRDFIYSVEGRKTIAKQKAYLNYLKGLGISDEDLESYIPGEKQIQQIESLRLAAERDAIDNYLITRNDFKNFQIQNPTIPLTTYDPLFAIFKTNINKHQRGEHDACVDSRMYDDEDNNFRSIMSYSIRKMGELFYSFLHECTHICEHRASHEVGFDIDYTENKYNSKYRLYERFNETVSDYFTREGLKFLHSNGKFLMESDELTNMDYGSKNTPEENALLLEPLLSNPKCREAIIEVKNGGDPEIFFELIGKDNFDKLVDILNYVDFLASNSNFKTNQQLQIKYELARMKAAAICQDIGDYVKTKQEVI